MALRLNIAVLTFTIVVVCCLATSEAGPVPFSQSPRRRSAAAEQVVSAEASRGTQLKSDTRVAASRGSPSGSVPSWIKELLVASQAKMPSRWFVSPNAQPHRTGSRGGSRHPLKNIRPPPGVFRAPL